LLRRVKPLLAQSGRIETSALCPLSGVKRTSPRGNVSTDRDDSTRHIAGWIRGSLRLDVCLSNSAAVFIIVLANMSGEIRAARRDRKQSLRWKFRFDLGCLPRGA